MYTKLPYHKLKNKLSLIINFVFKGGNKKFIKLFINDIWHSILGYENKNVTGTWGTVKHHSEALNQLIEICYVKMGNVVMQQSIETPMETDPAPF